MAPGCYVKGPGVLLQQCRKNSAMGTRTRVARVRAEYPNQLDYSGFCYITEMENVIVADALTFGLCQLLLAGAFWL